MRPSPIAPARLSVSPVEGLIDLPRQVRVDGLQAHEEVHLTAHTLRGAGVPWRAQAHFRADAQGVVDLTRDAPLDGDYTGVSAMGLVWSQAPEVPGTSREVFADPPSAPLRTDLYLRRTAGPGDTPSAHFVQHLTGPGVARRVLREDGLVGTLFLPTGPGPHPAVIVLNGSNGGLNEPRAALYASHGFAALALAYFNAPGLSPYISNTRLEYFRTAFDWLRRTVQPAHDFVALSGQSRGGELVLLLASLFPQEVSAVIGYVPGAVVHSAQNACDPATGREGPAWLLGGEALPHLWQHNRSATWAPWDEGPPPRRHALALLTALQDAEAVERARIRVEHIAGPVMLLSGTDDGSWPSSLYGRMVSERLAMHRHPHEVQHMDFEGAGHAIVFPFVPTTQITYTHPVSGRASTGGGTPADNAHANEASWQGVLPFLQRAFQRHSGSNDQRRP